MPIGVGTAPDACCHHAARRDHRIYVPTKPKPSQADLEAFRVAGEKMQELIAAAGTTEEELVEDLKKLRRGRRIQKG